MIRDADTIVFVLSPASASSEVCNWEVSEAVRLGKRVIPVVCRPLHNASLPPQLAALNYIFFYAEPRSPGSGFGTGLARLVTALNTDLEWVREHTRLLQRAAEWEAAGRAESRLLFGDSISAAKVWAGNRPTDAPEPTTLHYDFIRASEQAEKRRLDAERQQLEQMAAVQADRAKAQADRAKALAEREIAQKREAEQARRVVRRTVGGMIVAIVFAVAAGGAGFVAFVQRDRARDALAQILAERSWSSLASGRNDLAIRYALAGSRVAQKNAAHHRAPLAQAMASPIVPVAHQLHKGEITVLVSSPDGRYLVSGGKDGSAWLLDATSVQPIHNFSHDGQRVTAAAIDPSGRRVLTVSEDGAIYIWNMQSGQNLVILRGHTARVTAAIFSPDATRLASASADKTVRLWDLSTGWEIAALKGHKGGVSALAFSPDGRRLVTGGRDHEVLRWDTATGHLIGTPLTRHAGAVTAIAFSPDGRLLLTGSTEKVVLVWNLNTPDEKQEPKKLAGHESGISAVTMSADGAKVHVIDSNGNAYIWDPQTATIVVASASGAEHNGLASFGFGGTYAAIAGKDGALWVWDAGAARTLRNLRDQGSPPVSAIVWSEQRLFVGDESGMLSVYDLRELTEPVSNLIARACTTERVNSRRFSWMESAVDPLIRQVWDPEGISRSVCE